jgi:hypothetical protein
MPSSSSGGVVVAIHELFMICGQLVEKASSCSNSRTLSTSALAYGLRIQACWQNEKQLPEKH